MGDKNSNKILNAIKTASNNVLLNDIYLIILEYIDHTLVYSVKNCIHPFAANYAILRNTGNKIKQEYESRKKKNNNTSGSIGILTKIFGKGRSRVTTNGMLSKFALNNICCHFFQIVIKSLIFCLF